MHKDHSARSGDSIIVYAGDKNLELRARVPLSFNIKQSLIYYNCERVRKIVVPVAWLVDLGFNSLYSQTGLVLTTSLHSLCLTVSRADTIKYSISSLEPAIFFGHQT